MSVHFYGWLLGVSLSLLYLKNLQKAPSGLDRVRGLGDSKVQGSNEVVATHLGTSLFAV